MRGREPHHESIPQGREEIFSVGGRVASKDARIFEGSGPRDGLLGFRSVGGWRQK